MYLSVTLQSLRTIVTPVEGVDTREDRVEAMRILAAGNTIIILLLGVILALQVSVRFVCTCYYLATAAALPLFGGKGLYFWYYNSLPFGPFITPPWPFDVINPCCLVLLL